MPAPTPAGPEEIGEGLLNPGGSGIALRILGLSCSPTPPADALHVQLLGQAGEPAERALAGMRSRELLPEAPRATC